MVAKGVRPLAAAMGLERCSSRPRWRRSLPRRARAPCLGAPNHRAHARFLRAAFRDRRHAPDTDRYSRSSDASGFPRQIDPDVERLANDGYSLRSVLINTKVVAA